MANSTRVVGALARRDVGGVLLRREHLLEQGAELDLAPRAARLDVGQHALEIADARGQRLHLAQAAMHLLEPLAHHLERLGEALLQRGVEFLVHRLAHLLQLGGVVLLQLLQLALQGPAHLGERALVGLGERDEALVERVAETLERRTLLLAAVAAVVAHALPEGGEALGKLVDLPVLDAGDVGELFAQFGAGARGRRGEFLALARARRRPPRAGSRRWPRAARAPGARRRGRRLPRCAVRAIPCAPAATRGARSPARRRRRGRGRRDRS